MLPDKRYARSASLRISLALALIASLPFASGAQGPVSSDAREAYAEALDFIARKDWRSARVELLNAAAAAPDWPDAHLRLAEVALQLFDGVAAKAELDRAEKLGAERQAYTHLLGHALWLSGDLARAQEVLTTAPVAREHLPYAYRILARVQLDRGDSIAASDSLDKALALAPEDSMVWTEIGRLRLVISNQGGAIEALERAVAIDPANIRALELRGRLVRAQYGMLAALPWFERGLQIDPNDVPLLEEYAATLAEAGRYRDALAQARKLLSLDTRNARGFYVQAAIAARAGNCALSRRLMDKVGGRFAALSGPQLLIAACDYQSGNFNQAIDRLSPLVEAQPDNAVLRKLLARALHRSGDQQTAWAAIAPLADRNDADNYTLRLAARIAEALGEGDRAAALLDAGRFQRALRSDPLPASPLAAAVAAEAERQPGNAAKVIPYIRLLLADGRVDAARQRAAALLRGNEGVAEAQILAGDIETLAGNHAAAAEAYQRARGTKFSADLLLRLVPALRRAGDPAAATAAIEAYIRYNPADPTAMRLWAFDLMDRERWSDAVPWLYRLRHAVGPNDVVLGANIARALSALGSHDDAIREARLAYFADPASFMTTRTYGAVLLAAKRRPKDARDLLRKASKFAPGDAGVRRDYLRAVAQAG